MKQTSRTNQTIRRLLGSACLVVVIGGLTGCQTSRGWFSASRLGHPADAKSQIASSDNTMSDSVIRPVSAEREVPIINATDTKTGSSRLSKLFSSFTKPKPKRIPLPRTDDQSESESETTPVENRDADVPTLSDL